jgi:hypothetical protein
VVSKTSIRALSAIAALALLAGGGSGPATGATSSGTYSAYVACSRGSGANPAHKCRRGDKVGAFLKSAVDAQFTLCVRFPGGQRLCAHDQSVSAGKPKVNAVTTDKLGRHKLTWSVGGRKIVRYFHLTR